MIVSQGPRGCPPVASVQLILCVKVLSICAESWFIVRVVVHIRTDLHSAKERSPHIIILLSGLFVRL